ncbi:polyprotein [Erysiphe cichoracearum alphaendornavirus]|uniref:Polyprotein n=1 Tax=Erysiphe cichoracearum alphaendornavirus TaxID=1777015 RepID=A0A0U3U4C2_9VIRU|nr:polyprotein [Erysiphe cichoracearum alphaendornavirus]ALX17418.1 polyprotein [Erysiphe cichoracearum alphaendornavirus]
MTPRQSQKSRQRNTTIHSGRRRNGGARNEIKLKTLMLFQHGVQGSHDIPPITMKQTLKGDNQYIDTYLADCNDVVNTKRLGISGVINIYHSKATYPVCEPYSSMTFNGNTSHVRDGKYYIDDYHGEVQDLCSFEKYRADLLRDIRSSKKTHGTKKKMELINWLTDKSTAFPYGNMAQKRDGFLELLDGYYIKCAHCDCLTYLPLSTLINPNVTKAQLTQFLRDFSTQKAEFFPDAEIYGELAMMVPMCFSSSSGSCFNCDEDLFSETINMMHAIYTESIAYHNTIRGTHIEEMTKLNMLQGAPPDDMPVATAKYNELHNRHAAKALAKMNINHINTIYSLNDSTRLEMMHARAHTRITNTARMNTTPMSILESEEILLVSDLASATAGNLVHHPTTITTNASLRDIVDTVCNGPYFADTGVTIDIPTAAADYLEIIPAQHDMDKMLNYAASGAYVMLIRPDVHNVIVKQDSKYYYTLATGTDVPVKWDIRTHALLSNCAKLHDGQNHYNIHTISHGAYLQIIKLELSDSSMHARTLGNQPTFTASIPVFDPLNPLASLGVFGTKWEYRQINVELLRRLVTFALTADKSPGAIEAYYAGILSTHYTIGGKVVDLSNTPVSEGVPEIIYAMMILSNRKLVTMWASILHLNNYSSVNGLKTITNFFLSRLIRVAVQLADKVLPWFEGVLSKPSEFAKRLVNTEERIDVESVFAKLLPLLIITSVNDTQNPAKPAISVSESAVCHHHTSECNHQVGDVRCICCGVLNMNSICECCAKHTKCRHSCNHACTNKLHICKKCANGERCVMRARCPCCNVYGCIPCPICPQLEKFEVSDVQPTTAMSLVTKVAHRTMKVPESHRRPVQTTPAISRPNLGNDALINLAKSQAVFKPSDTKHMLHTDYMNINKPNHLFVIDHSDLYIPMLSFTGQYYVPINLPTPVVSNPIPGTHYCAYACIADQTNNTIESLKNMHGDRHSMDAQELRHLIKLLGLNCLLLLNSRTAEILRYGPQASKYLLIAHGSITAEVPHNHWFVPHIPEFVDMPTGYYGPHNLGQPFEDMSQLNMWKASTLEMGRINKKISVMRRQLQHNKPGATLELPRVTLIGNSYYLTNGKTHEPRIGNIHFMLPPMFDEELVEAVNGSSSKLVKSLYANQTNEWEQVETDAINLLKLKCCDINNFLTSINDVEDQNKCTRHVIDSDEPFVPTHVLGKLKPLDVVRIVQGSQSTTIIVAGEAAQPVVCNPYGAGAMLYQFKVSLSSLYRSLIMVTKAISNLDNVKTMKFGRVVDGVAGSGKSTLIKSFPNREKTTLVCKTRSAMESHIDSGFHSRMTMEAAGLSEIITSTLVIDEASMITNVELLSCLDSPHMQVHMLGDSYQIGVKDMSSVLGSRDENSLLAQLKNEALTHTYRFGQPLVDTMLKQFVPNITCQPDVTTKLTHLTADNYDKVLQYCSDHNVNAVYVFMHADYLQLMHLVGDKLSINKVHASQGKEFDTVLVLHWGNFSQETSIVRSSKFIFTAATRARKHLIWVTPPAVKISLSSILDIAYIGSGYADVSVFDVDRCALTRNLTKLEMELLGEMLPNHPTAKESNSKFVIKPHCINVTALGPPILNKRPTVSFVVDKSGTYGTNTVARMGIEKIKSGIRKHFPSSFAKLQAEIQSIENPVDITTPTETSEMFSKMTLSPNDAPSSDTTDIEHLKPKTSFTQLREPTILSNGSETSSSEDSLNQLAAEERTSHTNPSLLTAQLNYMVSNLNHKAKEQAGQVLGNVLVDTDDHHTTAPYINDRFSFGTPTPIVVKQIHLNSELWSRMIVLADVVLAYQCTNAAITWKVDNSIFKLSIHNGCSLYCGFKFEFETETVLISSAHADDSRDGALTTLNACNRHIVGTTTAIVKVLSFFSDNSIFGPVSRNVCMKTYRERLSNIFTAVISNCTFDSVGERFGNRNEEIAQSCIDYSDSWCVPTHQSMTHFIVNSDTGVTLQPANITVTGVHALIRMFSGIRGEDAVFTLNRANKATLDRTLIRHMNAEEKFDRPVSIPTQLMRSELWAPFLQQVGSNVITPVALGVTSISTIHGAMLLGGAMLKQMFGTDTMHYVGLNAQLFTINYNIGDTIEKVPGDGMIYIKNMLKAKVKSYTQQLEVESDPSKKEQLLSDINFLGDINNVLRSTIRGVVICHPPYYDAYAGDNCYTCYPHTTYPTCLLVKGNLIESSEDGTKFSVDISHTVIMGVVGSYYLHKKVTNLPSLTVQASELANPNYRVFASNVAGMETVKIPDAIFRRMVARAFAERDTTLPDMVAYSRSLLNTMTYTSKGYSFRYNDNPLELLQYSVVVLNFANRQRKLTSFVGAVLGASADDNSNNIASPIITLLTEALKTIGLQVAQGVFEQPLAILHEMLTRGTINTPIVSDVFAVLRDANYQEIFPSVRLIQRHHTDTESTMVVSPQHPGMVTQEEVDEVIGEMPTSATLPSGLSQLVQPVVSKFKKDVAQVTTQSQVEIIRNTSNKLINTWYDMRDAWNKYVKNDDKFQPWEFDAPIGDVLLLYAGSRGDAQPLDTIAEIAVKCGLSVKALIPADLHSRIPGVTYVEYCSSYDHLTNSGVNGTLPDVGEFAKHAMDVYQHWLIEHMKHRIVIGLFFSSEANLVHGTEKNIRIIPQLDDEWDGNKKCAHGMGSNSIRALFQLPQPKLTSYWAVPFDVLDRADNLGFLIPQYSLSIDNNTDMALRFSKKHNGKVRVITLGSMLPSDFAVRIDNMLRASELPPIFVTGKISTAQGTFSYKDISYEFSAQGMYEDICIVKSVNYLALTGHVQECHNHCGAGTYLTFKMMGVRQVPWPVAFDQHYNAYYCNETDVKSNGAKPSLSVEEQINKSARNVQVMLGVKGAVQNYELRLLHQVGEMVTIPTRIDSSIIMQEVITSGLKPIKNNYIDNCVLNVVLDCLERHPIISRQAENLYRTQTFITVSDVMEFLIQLPVSYLICHGGTAIMCKRQSDAHVRIYVTEDMSHAEEFTYTGVVNAAPVVDDVYQDLIVNGNFEDDIKIATRLLEGVPQPSVQQIINHLAQTSMRKLHPVEIFKGTTAVGHFQTTVRLSAGYSYACFTSDGVVMALCVPSVSGNPILLHMHDRQYQCAVVMRMNKLINIQVGVSRSLIRSTTLVAINHSTATKLKCRGIYVSSVGQTNADTLYIYDTWARKHHLEPEQDVIRSAKRIMGVPEEDKAMLFDLTTKRSLLLHNDYPVCIAKGKLYFRLEHGCEQSAAIISRIRAVSKVSDNLAILPYSQEKVPMVMIVFKYDGTKVTYSNTSDVSPPSTLQELVDLIKLDTQVAINQLKNMATQHGYMTLEACKIELVVKPISLPDLSMAVRRKLLIADTDILINLNAWRFQIVKQGAGFSKFDELIIPSLDDNKFNSGRYVVQNETESTTITNNMPALLPLDFSQADVNFVARQQLSYHAKENQIISVGSVGSVGMEVDAITLDEIPQSQVMDFWHNEELLDSNIILPTNTSFTVSSRIHPIRIKSNAYLLMEMYPMYARPSRSKAFAEELNSITNRHGAYTVYRKVNLDVKMEVQMLLDNYMRADCNQIIAQYQGSQINFEPAKAQAWIDKHNMPAKVRSDVIEMLNSGWERTPINAMSVHGKTEQTTKMKTTRWFDEVVTRSIVAAPYAVSALFADIFLEAKQRLKALLSDKVFYSDGSTPLELAAVIRSSEDFTFCVEDDLTQQDRQVDHQLIAVEMELYKLLGVSGNVLAFYRMCHEKWSWKGHGISGVWDAMRLSGQVTTALGNAITNMIVHNRFMLRNKSKICKMLFLGDDIIFLMKQEVTVTKHGTETKELYNMQSKIVSRRYVGGFISMVVYNIAGNVGICPHFKRMRHRFSVCNYTYPVDETADKVKSRVLSYLYMIGDCAWARALVEKMGYSVQLPQWYHMDTAIVANSLYDEEEEWQTRSHISALRYMLENQVVKRHKFLTWSSV